MTVVADETGWLDVSGGHRIYWEIAGNPKGIPAIALHGGPGSGSRPGFYDLFDLERFRVVLIDQRGAGKSLPAAAQTVDALVHNTTDDLLADLEAVREFFGIKDWLVFGGSWGSTLGLLYAQMVPERVKALVLAGVATTAHRDLQWLYGDVGNLFPESFARFTGFAPNAADTFSLIAAYGDALCDPKRAQNAADEWCAWELGIFQKTFEEAGGNWTDPQFRLGFARVVTHYFRNFAWRDDNHITKNMARIAHIPGIMIHSRFDPSCPLRAPWELAQAWPAARLEILDGNSHSALSQDMSRQIRLATDAFAQSLI